MVTFLPASSVTVMPPDGVVWFDDCVHPAPNVARSTAQMTTHAAFFGVMFMLIPQKRQERILRRIRVHGGYSVLRYGARAGDRQTEVPRPSRNRRPLVRACIGRR